MDSPVSAYQHLLGKTLAGRFELLECIGMGGMSVVFKALHKDLNQIVCVKVLRQEVVAGNTGVLRLQTEAKALATLVHPNILRSIAMDTSDDCMFLATEFIEGQTLDKVLEQGPLEERRAREIIAQLASGLAYAHSRGVIHRDLKPSNIMLTGAGGGSEHAKILDFGIAKILDNEQWQKLTKSGMLIGTPQYMAPEQCSEGICDARTDIYSLGCILHECLNGKPPFAGESAMEVMMMHLYDAPSAVPGALGAVSAKAMAKDPSERFQTAEEMLTALNDASFAFTAKPQMPRIKTKTLARATGILSAVGVGITCAMSFAIPAAKLELPPHDMQAKLPKEKPKPAAAVQLIEQFRNHHRTDRVFVQCVDALLNIPEQLDAYSLSEVCETKAREMQEHDPQKGNEWKSAEHWYKRAVEIAESEQRINAWAVWELMWINSERGDAKEVDRLYTETEAKIRKSDPEISTPESKEALAVITDGIAGINSDIPTQEGRVDHAFETVALNRERHSEEQLRAIYDRVINKTRLSPTTANYDWGLNLFQQWEKAHPNQRRLVDVRYKMYVTELKAKRDGKPNDIDVLTLWLDRETKDELARHTNDSLGYVQLRDNFLIPKAEADMKRTDPDSAYSMLKFARSRAILWNDKKSLKRIDNDIAAVKRPARPPLP